MAGAVAPPLPAADAACVNDERAAVGRGCCLEFGEEFLAADLHRRAAIGADAEDVGLARDILHAAGEIEIFAIGRPGVELLARLGIGQSRHRAAGEIEHIDVLAAAARRGEGEPRAVGGVKRAALGRAIGDQEARDAAACRDFPDIPARGEGDQAAVGRQARLGEGGPIKGRLGDLRARRRCGQSSRREQAASRQRQASKCHQKGPFFNSVEIKGLRSEKLTQQSANPYA